MDSSLSVSLMVLLTDIVLWEKGMKETNTLAYFGREIDIACKKWYSAGPGGGMGPGGIPIKLFAVVIY
jgi:hypothetical protein